MSRGRTSKFKVDGGPFHGKEIPLSASVSMAPVGERVTFSFSASGFTGHYVKASKGGVRWHDERAQEEEPCLS